MMRLELGIIMTGHYSCNMQQQPNS